MSCPVEHVLMPLLFIIVVIESKASNDAVGYHSCLLRSFNAGNILDTSRFFVSSTFSNGSLIFRPQA